VGAAVAPGKVINPLLMTRIKQRDKLTALGVSGMGLRTLELVASKQAAARLLSSSLPPSDFGKMCSITNGVPVTLDEVWQYSHRAFAAEITC